MIEDNFDEIDSEPERISLKKFNEVLACINDDTDNTSSAISDVDFEDFEDFEKEVKEQEVYDERDEIIDYLEQLRFTPCVIIDFIEGKFQRCNGIGKLRQLRNLFGTWQVDRDAIKEVDGVLSKLGVCDSHFQFDNKYLHKSLDKQTKDFNEGIIQWRRCVFCDKYITFFSRGVGCAMHSWCLNKRNIQVPCIGQYSCKVLRSHLNLCNKTFDKFKRPQCLCCLCYEKLGGHIHHRSGIRGKSVTTCITEKLHDDDITKELEFMGNLLIKIAQMEDNEIKKQILIKIFEVLLPLTNKTYADSTTTTASTLSDDEKQEKEKVIFDNPPSLFMVKFLFMKILKKINQKKTKLMILR